MAEDIRRLSDALSSLQGVQQVLLHSIQFRSRSFYARLAADYNVKIVEIRKPGLRHRLTRLLLGRPALIPLREYSTLPAIFDRVAEQGMAAIYCVRSHADIDQLAPLESPEFNESLQRDTTFFGYQVDEDSADRDGRMVIRVFVGSECPRSLVEAVIQSQQR